MDAILELEPSTLACTVVRPGAADAYWLVTELMEPLLDASQSDGRLDVVRTVASPKGGPPPHRHSREDELFYVIDGEFEFISGKSRFTAGAGTAVFLPRGQIHTYNNIGKQNGRLLVTAAPSGFAKFVTTTGEICLDRKKLPQVGPATFEKLGAGCGKAGIELLPAHVADQHVSQPYKPRDLWVLGTHVRLLLTSEQTSGQFSVAEVTTQPGDFVPPHKHLKEDEIFYVLEGEFEFDTRDGIVNAPAGTFVYVPRQTLHGFRNCGRISARMLDIHTPGGFENFFFDAGSPCTNIKAGPPKVKFDMERVVELFKKHGMEM